ncbi:hypothetical protein PICMEDRAFT_11534 [Pichia membranifaciens NRRL Y-2026]|uniref:Vacuolar protein sorting-associated protein 75 n=1 Tax=Pichia membranifaciens NRRL Y-2026 TaxID=763406 RepID=A0A1E3NK95_9ASCO|nr:hypothetical protein PICMEDRAFT_11534 [Pichia membranifaciens NRRL Y-2026]ODQ46540.1 hypothetical protein PICMEDRAFT_11534 [Pichia membranifaciens NRRL Y-2026]
MSNSELDTPVDKSVEESFVKLQKIESEIQSADAQVEQFKNQLFTPIYRRRRKLLDSIPKFWYVVLAQHEDFQEYVSVEDMKYIELISDLYVEFWDETKFDDGNVTTIATMPKKGFTLTILFKNVKAEKKDNEIEEQEVTKNFEWVIDPSTGSRRLESEPVTIKWPSGLSTLDPMLIKQRAKEEKRTLSDDDKKRYRKGMRSFFSFWQWSGRKPGKEYRNGEELATLIAEDIFPAALDYYVLAAPGIGEQGDDEDEDESGEELDLSEQEEADDESQRNVKRQKKA